MQYCNLLIMRLLHSPCNCCLGPENRDQVLWMFDSIPTTWRDYFHDPRQPSKCVVFSFPRTDRDHQGNNLCAGMVCLEGTSSVDKVMRKKLRTSNLQRFWIKLQPLSRIENSFSVEKLSSSLVPVSCLHIFVNVILICFKAISSSTAIRHDTINQLLYPKYSFPAPQLQSDPCRMVCIQVNIPALQGYVPQGSTKGCNSKSPPLLCEVVLCPIMGSTTLMYCILYESKACLIVYLYIRGLP